MTMFPAHRQKKDIGYGGSCSRYSFEGEYEECFMRLGSDLMADDESRTEISNNNKEGSSSKDDLHNKLEEEEWLQLSLGSGHYRPGGDGDQISRLIELDLLPASSSGDGGGGESSSSQQLMMMRPLTLTSTSTSTPPPPPLPLPLQQQQQLSFHVPDFRLTTATVPPTSSLFLQPQYGRSVGDSSSVPAAMTTSTTTFTHDHYLPFNYPPLLLSSSASLEQQLPVHPSMDMRVVDPPPRPHSGVWFMLQPSQNQTKEPYLPQLPKSYLRIRDGRTSTIGLLIKYLVNKLKLDSEFEIEITCKGQQLLPFMTLHHVRNNIWRNPRNDAVFSRTSANVDDHLMVLKYGRIA